jgi:nicotinate-nucleotide adenylyltransferase
MKIGILGGTFNPIHIGHLILADEVREKLKLDRIIFVPANQPPHKQNYHIVQASTRYRMVKLAIQKNNHFCVSDVEIERTGRSYTIDTIREFKKRYPKDKLFFIIGSDLLKYLADWRDLSEITKMVKLIVATRPGYALAKIPGYMSRLPIRAVDISGFEIRKAIKENRSFRYLVSEPVYNYIIRKKLYKVCP